MVKNNKTAIKGLLVLGGVSTAAASVYTLSKKYAKKLLYRHHKHMFHILKTICQKHKSY